jgi:hypothetical protein
VRRCLALVACSSLAALVGCEDLDEFRTGPDEVFHGRVIGSDSQQDVPSFIRAGFPSFTQMELTFDPMRAMAEGERVGSAPSAGTLDTYVCAEEVQRCKSSLREQGDFEDAKLEPIERLAHDALSEYDFPGGGRLRNYMLSARSTVSTAEGEVERSAMVFLSLMESGSIEVRVIAPSVRRDEVEIAPALFGVFVLERQRK